MIAWDALISAGENFAYIVTTEILGNKSLLYDNSDWFEELFNDFLEFTETSFYKIIDMIAPDFFFKFFQESVKNELDYFVYKVNSAIAINFGIGNGESYFASLIDAFNGNFEILNWDNFSSGIIINNNTIGTYSELLYDKLKGFYGSIRLSFEIDFNDFSLPSSGFNTFNADIFYTPLAVIIGIILSLLNCGDLELE